MHKHDDEWNEVMEDLQSLSLEELQAFLPIVEAMAIANKQGFLFSDYETLQ